MARIPKNPIATEIDRLKSINNDIDIQKAALSEAQEKHRVAIEMLELTGLGEWEEVPDTQTMGEGAV